MKLFFILSLIVMNTYPMDDNLKGLALIFEEEQRFGLDPLKYQEFVKAHIKDIEKPINIDKTQKLSCGSWCTCTKTKAVVAGALITACSGITVAIISGIITVIVTIYK